MLLPAEENCSRWSFRQELHRLSFTNIFMPALYARFGFFQQAEQLRI